MFFFSYTADFAGNKYCRTHASVLYCPCNCIVSRSDAVSYTHLDVYKRQQVREGIERYAVVRTEEFGDIYAYEVDGYGQCNLMDDANVPSLLSMSYLGYEPLRPEVAENTRRFLLSDANPYYFHGTKAAGIGSPHTPSNYIWHIAMAMEGLTEKDHGRRLEILRSLADCDGGTGMMHEGFHCDDPTRFTRKWFSWANAMYAELLLSCIGEEVKK